MAHPILECVPNFSEGRDLAKIKRITDVVEAVPGVTLLDVDPGADTNRTVVTFVGPPEAVMEAAFQAVAKAAEVIDMREHKGAHPRMGATDVLPFVPVAELSLEDCARMARTVGSRIGKELEIPVYLYEAAAARPERKNLASVRKGEYEGLAEKLTSPDWAPDFGPAKMNVKSGAVICGAREFLIAYNVTLNTRDKMGATDIALAIREKGRPARKPNPTKYYTNGDLILYERDRFPCGNCDYVASSFDAVAKHCLQSHDYDLAELMRMNDDDPHSPLGKSARRAGKFKHCKAIGWYVEKYKRAQISINLTNYHVTSPHLVLEEARRLATERGLVVTGSEIVGLIPYDALLEAGRYYLRAQGRSPYVPVSDILEVAVFSMGLNDVSAFDIKKKVIGMPNDLEQGLIHMTVRDFVDEVSRDTPAPGGGSIAALVGALGAALVSMVANLTQKKPTSKEHEKILLDLAAKAQSLKDQLMLAVDEDTNAFNGYISAIRLPQGTPEEKKNREQRMQEGLKVAIDVPLKTAFASFEAMQIAFEIAQSGNPNSLTDGAVGNAVAYAGVRGGIWNVLINLKGITDKDYVRAMQAKCAEILKKAQELQNSASEFVDEKLLSMINVK